MEARQSIWRWWINFESVIIISDFIFKQFLPTLTFWLYLVGALFLIDLTGAKMFSNGKLAGVDLAKKLSSVLFDENIFIAIFLAMLLLLVLVVVLIAIYKDAKWLPSLEAYFIEGVNQLNSFSAIFIVSGIGLYIESNQTDWKLIRTGAYIGLIALIIQWVLKRFFNMIAERVSPNTSAITSRD